MAVTEKLDTQQVILGVLIALLRREFPAIRIQEQVAEGIRIAKKLLVTADVAKTGGDSFIIDAIEGQIAFNAQNVGVYLEPEWAAKEGLDKNWHRVISAQAYGIGEGITYVIPAGKTLYISGFACRATADDIANANEHQTFSVEINNYTDTVNLISFGGDGGGGLSLNKPFAVEGGKTVKFQAWNWAAHTSSFRLTVWGYEI